MKTAVANLRLVHSAPPPSQDDSSTAVQVCVREPESVQDRFLAFRIVHDQYASISLIEPRKSQLRFFLRDFLPVSTLFLAAHEGTVVGTSAMVRWSEIGLPCLGIYEREVRALVNAGRIVAESTKFACTPIPSTNSRGAGRMSVVSTAILQALFHWCWEGGISDWLLVVHPRVRDFYEGALGFRFLGAERSCSHVQGKPGVLLGLDVAALRDHSQQPTPLAKELFFSQPSPIIHQSRSIAGSIASDEVALFLFSDPPVWHDAAGVEQSELRREFPELDPILSLLPSSANASVNYFHERASAKGGFECFYPSLVANPLIPQELTPAPVTLRLLVARIDAVVNLQARKRCVSWQIAIHDKVPDELVTVPCALGALIAVTARILIEQAPAYGYVRSSIYHRSIEDGECSLELSFITNFAIQPSTTRAINQELLEYTEAITLAQDREDLCRLRARIDCLLAPHALPTVLFEASLSTQEKQTTRHAPAPQARSLKILVVEDNVVQQLLLRKVLSGWGHTVEIAKNGELGLKLWREMKPDCILLDIQLPDCDGFSIARRIRSEEIELLKHSTPMYACTSFVLSEDPKRCREAGMDGYLPKPTSLSDLSTVIGSVMERVNNTNSYSPPISTNLCQGESGVAQTFRRPTVHHA